MSLLLLKFFLGCCKSSGLYFVYVLQIVNRSPGNHDKVIYINFLRYVDKSDMKVAVYGGT